MTTEILSAAARFISVAAAAGILGGAVFFYACARGKTLAPRLARCLLVLAVSVCLAHGGLLAAQFQAVIDAGTGGMGWREFVMDTHVGRVWLWRSGAALSLLAVSLVPVGGRGKVACAAVLAALYLGLGPWGGHASGAADLAWVLSLNVVHVLAVSAWFGALPAWLWSVGAYARGQGDGHALAQTLARFSRLAMVLMAVIVTTGVWLADLYIDDEGDLLGTRYGWLVVAKALLLVAALYFANRLRREFLPALKASAPGLDAARAARRHVGAELALAGLVLGCAAWLAQTTPALHEPQPQWWLPFRWSFDATWAEPSLRGWIVAGAALVVAAVCAMAMKPLRQFRLIAAACLGLTGAVTLAWALAVEAYPGTFVRAQVPYLTLSVAHGRSLYEAQCTSCHGPGGLGDGPLAASMPRPPANLSEPHTALHTAGDMFWWLTHGIPQSGMPPFESVMTPEDRWDTINFMRAFSQGFESRILGPRVVPGQAWLGAINFYIEGSEGPGELKGYRESDNVLLVFLGDPSAAARAQALGDAHAELRSRRTQVIAVPTGGIDLSMPLPYPVIREGGDDLWAAYQLLTRTVANRGAPDRVGMEWTHAEFLIDRFGYVRARWIANEDPAGWNDLATLHGSLDFLNTEPQLKPFPDDHIH